MLNFEFLTDDTGVIEEGSRMYFKVLCKDVHEEVSSERKAEAKEKGPEMRKTWEQDAPFST